MEAIETYSSSEEDVEGGTHQSLTNFKLANTSENSKEFDRPSKFAKLVDSGQMLKIGIGNNNHLIQSLAAAVRHVVPSDILIQQRLSDWNRFENSILLSKFPELRQRNSIELFGSWTYGMWTPSSDIDCNIRAPTTIPNFFNRLKTAVMIEFPGSTVRIVVNCKVPVSKISLPRALRIDVTHECGHQDDGNTHNELVRDWASRWKDNKVVCTSFRVVKQWAAANKIHDPLSGSLNSMGYLVMLLAIIGPEDCCDPCCGEFSRECLEKVLNVLLRFFRTYSTVGQKKEIIYAPHGVVKREGVDLDILRLTADVEDREHRGFGSTLFIQDPFLSSTNLGRFVDKYSIKNLRNAFSKAHEVLQKDSQDPFQNLLKCFN